MTPFSTNRNFRILAGALAVGAVAIAGCSSSGTSSSSPPSGSGSTKPTLVVYSAQGYDKAMVAAFKKAYPNIPTTLDDNSTGPLLTQIEASKNNPNWGLLWVDGATAFAGLDQQGLLLKGFEPNVQFNSLGTASLPADKSYVPTGVTMMAAVVYNKTKVTNPPTTWQQLLSSQWKGVVGMNDPSQSGPTYPFIAGMMNYLGGVSQGEAFFSRLKANGLIIHPTNGPTLQALTSGQIKLALVQSSAGIGAAIADKKLAVKYLNPVTLLPSAIGIDAKAPAAVAGGGAEVHRVRAVTGWPEGHADRRPDRRLAVLPGRPGRQPAAGAAVARLGEDPDHRPVQLGTAGGDHQHLVRLQHRQVMTANPPSRMTLVCWPGDCP